MNSFLHFPGEFVTTFSRLKKLTRINVIQKFAEFTASYIKRKEKTERKRDRRGREIDKAMKAKGKGKALVSLMIKTRKTNKQSKRKQTQNNMAAIGERRVRDIKKGGGIL